MANTQKDVTLSICTTPQPDDLTEAGFEALVYVAIGQVGSVGETGLSTNILTYDTLTTAVSQKAKGISDAGSPEIEVARNYNDAGQVALRNAAATNFNYAFKLERNDAPDASTTNTVIYNRGLVIGPRRPNGRNEDFDLEIFQLALQQAEVVVNPEASVAPVNTLLPAISGTMSVGNTLTAYEGKWTNDPTSFTYQWQADAAGNGVYAAISGATSSTYVLTAGEQGDSVRVVVTATNGGGSTAANSGGTRLIAA